MTRIDTDIENDDQELSESFEGEGEGEGEVSEVLPESEKSHQQLMQKRRAVEERLAQMQLERETRDFYFDDLDD